MRMGMEIRGGDGGEEHEEVSRDGEGEVGVMASLESWRVGDLWSGKAVLVSGKVQVEILARVGLCV